MRYIEENLYILWAIAGIGVMFTGIRYPQNSIEYIISGSTGIIILALASIMREIQKIRDKL